jgi:type IV fimbrial biogenesis protein FimT
MIGFQRTQKSGFSIIEVLIVVAIAAILAAIAIPAFNVFIGNTRTSTVANEFVSVLNLARSEAMKRGRDVTVCPRKVDGTDCDLSRNWIDGWLVKVEGSNEQIRLRENYFDPDRPQKFDFDGENAFESAKLTFDRSGRLISPSNVDDEETPPRFKVESMGKTMCIRVNSSGRIRSQKNC